MNWLMVIISLLIVLFVLVAVTKVTVKTTYRHQQDNDLLEVKVFLWGLKVYSFSAPLIKIDKDSASIIVKEKQKIGMKNIKKTDAITVQTMVDSFQHFKEFLRHVIGFHKIVKRFFQKVSIYDLKWHTDIGVGDAAYSAQLTGVLWTIKGSIMGLIGNYMKLKQMPKLSVHPHFQEVFSYTYFSCMISFRIGHAIIAGLMLIKHWKRRPTLTRPNSVEENM